MIGIDFNQAVSINSHGGDGREWSVGSNNYDWRFTVYGRIGVDVESVAARLAACWNACLDVDDPAAFRRQRAILLATAKCLAAWAELPQLPDMVWPARLRKAVLLARAALDNTALGEEDQQAVDLRAERDRLRTLATVTLQRLKVALLHPREAMSETEFEAHANIIEARAALGEKGGA